MNLLIGFFWVTLPGAVFGAADSFNCTFDDGNICSMTQEVTDVFDWTLQKGPTPSKETGPQQDHSNKGGYYIYIEASDPRLINDNARISTTKLKSGRWELVFYYHAAGNYIGVLSVYTKSVDSEYFKLLWYHSGRYNSSITEWTKVTLSLDEPSAFQVIFEGICSSGSNGDIAIDDIVASRPGPSTNLVKSAAHGLPIICRFEDGDSCSLYPYYAAQLNWTVHKGPTPSSDTGPSVDHTLGTPEGSYIYSESSISIPRSRSIIATHTFKPACGCYELEFWYHAYGDAVKSMTVVQEGYDIPLWKAKLTSMDAWIAVNGTFVTKHATKLLFIGEMGDDHTCDYALDDISIKDCGCPESKDMNNNSICDFNNVNICSMTQETTDAFNWTVKRGGIESLDIEPDRYYYYYYIHMEATSCSMRVYDNARISTEVLQPGEWNLTFYYHASGESVGLFGVYTRSVTSDYFKLLWYHSGRVNGTVDRWTEVELSLVEADDFQVIFEGTCSTGVNGDIALDDISAEQVSLSTVVSEPKPHGLPIECTFEEGSSCSLVNLDFAANLDWQMLNGSILNENLGPSVDHTLGTNQGSFIFTGNQFDIPIGIPDVALRSVLATPDFLPDCGCFNFEFWYYAQNGSEQGLIVVQDSYVNPLWFNTNIEEGAWTHVDYTNKKFYTDHSTKLLFIAVQGDVHPQSYSLDDILINDCGCQTNKPRRRTIKKATSQQNVKQGPSNNGQEADEANAFSSARKLLPGSLVWLASLLPGFLSA